MDTYWLKLKEKRYKTSTNLIKAAMQQMQLSAQAYHRILELARTIADLAGSPDIQTPHITKAI
jgi:magnesium chelatase family protein